MSPIPGLNEKETLPLRDSLAAQRTLLANERTFLAYIRTALTFFISGLTFVQFFESVLIRIVGWFFIPTGTVLFIIGALRFKRTKESIMDDEKGGEK